MSAACSGQLDTGGGPLAGEDADTRAQDVGFDTNRRDAQDFEPDDALGAQDTDLAPDLGDADAAPHPDSGEGDSESPDADEPDAEEPEPEEPDPVNNCPNVKVTTPEGLNLFIRPAPNTSGAPVGELPRHSIVAVLQAVQGESIDGNTSWYQITSAVGNGYISAYFATCTTEATYVDQCPNLKITTEPGVGLNIRSAPNTSGAVTGGLYGGMVVKKIREVQGQAIDGNTAWYEIESVAGDGYITAVFATCTTEPPAALGPPDGFYLPLSCGVSAMVTQGNNSAFSHNGASRYSWDFGLGLGTPLVAAADGIVIHTYAGTAPGSACDGGGPECINYANYVILLHGDDTTSGYFHLRSVSVNIGDFIPRGAQVGLSGQSGWSTGPHAHFQRMTNCGAAFPPSGGVCVTIPTTFQDYPANGGVPTTGVTVTSGNCP